MPGILIVDDQDIVRTGIAKMIQEMEIDFHPIYEAVDGIDALTIIKENKPDIILVDIMMPRKDGLQLIEELRNENLNMHIVIISAYNDFNFAKKAINFKVDNYILKPVLKNELYEVLMSIKNRIEKGSEEEKKSREKELQYDFILLYEYLTGNNIFIDTDRLFNSLGMPSRYTNYKIAVIYNESTESDEMLHFKRRLDEKLNIKEHQYISFSNTRGKLVYILNVKNVNDCECDSIIKENINLSDIMVNCGISEILESLHSLRELYRQADTALKESIFGKIRVCTFSDLKKYSRSILKMNELKKVLDLFNYGKKNELNAYLNDIFVKITKEGFSLSDVEITLFNLINYLYMNLIDAYPEICKIEQARYGLEDSKNIFKMKIVARNTVDSMYDHVQEHKQKDNANRIVNHIINYIINNFHRDISLTFISNDLSMNYCYVSELFSQKTGMSFSEYLIQVRLEKAKELLGNSNDKIHEIAEKTGFCDPKHFCKMFKKYFNITPGQYRDSY